MRENYSIFCKWIWIRIFRNKYFKRYGFKWGMKWIIQDSIDDIVKFFTIQ
jgi:hypothetical protein